MFFVCICVVNACLSLSAGTYISLVQRKGKNWRNWMKASLMKR
jgi:hypothetical protein